MTARIYLFGLVSVLGIGLVFWEHAVPYGGCYDQKPSRGIEVINLAGHS